VHNSSTHDRECSHGNARAAPRASQILRHVGGEPRQVARGGAACVAEGVRQELVVALQGRLVGYAPHQAPQVVGPPEAGRKERGEVWKVRQQHRWRRNTSTRLPRAAAAGTHLNSENGVQSCRGGEGMRSAGAAYRGSLGTRELAPWCSPLLSERPRRASGRGHLQGQERTGEDKEARNELTKKARNELHHGPTASCRLIGTRYNDLTVRTHLAVPKRCGAAVAQTAGARVPSHHGSMARCNHALQAEVPLGPISKWAGGQRLRSSTPAKQARQSKQLGLGTDLPCTPRIRQGLLQTCPLPCAWVAR